MSLESLLKHKFIVFCEDHYNPLGVVRSLGEEGIVPHVILVADKTPVLIPNSNYAKGCVKVVKTVPEGYDYLISEFSGEQEKPFIITCSDDIESFLDLHYDELKGSFHFFDGGGSGRITKVMEKNEMCRLAVESGIDVPKTEELKVGELPKGLRYPVMTKSVISTMPGWKQNVHICYSEDDLREAYKTIIGDRINVQEYIVKKNELCIDGVSINGGEELYMPIQSSYLRFSDKSYGNYILFEPFKEYGLLPKIQTLFRKMNFSGVFSIEFLRDQADHFYFLEINFRNSTWSYAHTAEGVNLPLIWAKSVLAGHLDVDDVVIKKDRFTAMAEDSDFKENVIHGNLSLGRWIKDFRECDCCFIHNGKDPKPFRRFLASEFWRLFRKFVLRIRPKSIG